MLSGNPFESELWHFCPLGCCPGGRPESIRKAKDAWDELFFSSMVPIPCVNRWTMLYPVVAWWLSSVLAFGLIASAWVAIHTSKDRPADWEEGLVLDQLVEPMTDNTHRAITRSRLRKSFGLIQGLDSRLRLAALAITLRPINMFMGYLFRTGAAKQQGTYNILHLADPAVSPVPRLLEFVWAQLQDLSGKYWILLRQADGWTPEKLAYALDVTVVLYVSLHLRCVRIFEKLPLSMWVLAAPGYPEEKRLHFYKVCGLVALKNQWGLGVEFSVVFL